MLKVYLEKLQASGIHCANPDCKKDPKYLVNILGHVWHVKVDTTIAVVSLGGKEEYYCRGCIYELYQMLKTKLDPKLWAFH
jgi:hypothetical protein